MDFCKQVLPRAQKQWHCRIGARTQHCFESTLIRDTGIEVCHSRTFVVIPQDLKMDGWDVLRQSIFKRDTFSCTGRESCYAHLMGSDLRSGAAWVDNEAKLS